MKRKEEIERALLALPAGGKASNEAFRTLHLDGYRILHDFLRRRGVNPEDAEEIIQTVFVRIFAKRSNLSFGTSSAWYAYLYESARNGIRDIKPQLAEVLEEDCVDHGPDLLTILDRQEQLQKLLKAADEVWLGSPPPDLALRCIVAKFVYVDGKSVSSIRDLLHADVSNVADVDRWLSDVRTLRTVAFEALYVSNHRLVAFILESPEISDSQLDGLLNLARKNHAEESAFNGWSWSEIEFILLRYRYGLPPSLAAMKMASPFCLEKIDALHDKCKARYPFVDTMTCIWGRLQTNPMREAALSKNSLWKRLVFHYNFIHELPQDSILERVSPAAAMAGYQLHNINAWVAGRLTKELANHFQGRED